MTRQKKVANCFYWRKSANIFFIIIRRPVLLIHFRTIIEAIIFDPKIPATVRLVRREFNNINKGQYCA